MRFAQPGAREASLVSRLLLVIVSAALVASGLLTWEAGPVAAASRPKAVVIVGPTGSLTADFLASGRQIAAQAEAAGMDVRRVFHPAATWQNVVEATRDANLVVYLGHGNGWPSPYGPFQEDTKDGFGLNPTAGGSPYSVEYRGADHLRAKMRLAPRAVVMILRSCYASGNGERWMGPERDRSVAVRRVDNFAAGFLDVGASAVFAFGTSQAMNLPALLMRSSLTMDELFRLRGSSDPALYDGFKGGNDAIVASQRTPGARIHVDPHPYRGYLRALTGDLDMTAARWRGDGGGNGGGGSDRTHHGKHRGDRHHGRDHDRPAVRHLRVISDGALDPSSATIPQFSPDGDGMGDRLRLGWELSEAASITAVIRGPDGRKARTIERRARAGEGSLTWDGRYRSGKRVPDGIYGIEIRARDRAGNTSHVKSVKAKVATTLRGYRVSAHAFSPWDRDRLAADVDLRVVLTRSAQVEWRIQNEDGKVVRTLREDGPAKAGVLKRTWDGRNDDRRFVSRGVYTATVVARTRDAVVRYAQSVYVGPFRIESSANSVRRGDRLTLTITATEPLRRAPVITVHQPGVKAWEVGTRKIGADRYRATIRTKDSRKRGSMELEIAGRDIRGGAEEHVLAVRVR